MKIDLTKLEFTLMMNGDVTEKAMQLNLPHSYDPVTNLSRVRVYAPTMPEAITEGEKIGKVICFL
jgi:hypothetical protein